MAKNQITSKKYSKYATAIMEQFNIVPGDFVSVTTGDFVIYRAQVMNVSGNNITVKHPVSRDANRNGPWLGGEVKLVEEIIPVSKIRSVQRYAN